MAEELRDVAMLLDDLRERVNEEDRQMLYCLIESVIAGAEYIERSVDA